MDIKDEMQGLITAARLKEANELADVLNRIYLYILKLERENEHFKALKQLESEKQQ
jgi:hypothetical protein